MTSKLPFELHYEMVAFFSQLENAAWQTGCAEPRDCVSVACQTMERLIRLVTIGLLSIWLVGCATPGRTYDDSKVAMIEKDATTQAELVEWFGPPISRTMEPEGGKVLTWKFAPRKVGTPRSSGRLVVRFGTDGKVISYAASSGTK